MSRPCPTLAAACWVSRSRGRRARPSGARPAAIAPEETSTVSPGRSAIASTSEPTRVRSNPPAAAVSADDPTLTTTRRAFVTSSRTPPILRCRAGVDRPTSPIVAGCGLRGGGTEPRRADPARPGDVVRGDRRVRRARRAAPGGDGHGPGRRRGGPASGGYPRPPDPPPGPTGGAAPGARPQRNPTP